MKLNPLYGFYTILAVQMIMMMRLRFAKTDNAWGGMNDMGIMILGVIVIVGLLAVFGFTFLNVHWAMAPLTLFVALLLLANMLSLAGIVPIMNDAQQQQVRPESIATAIACGYYLITLWLSKGSVQT